MAIPNFDVLQAAASIGSLGLIQGKVWYVRPRTGSDGTSGLSPRRALKTLNATTGALAHATASQNDLVYLMAEGASSDPTDTTDLQAAPLVWNKNMVHLIGVASGAPFSSRARIGYVSTYDAANPLVTVSANSCFFKDICFNVDIASTNVPGAVLVSGNRNHFENCHFAGICHANLDITGAYSLSVSGKENYFKNCIIGVDTIGRGTGDNCELLLTGAQGRNIFEDCIFASLAEVNTHQFVKRASGDRFTLFKNCAFINAVQSTGVTMLEAFDVTAGGPGGMIVLQNCIAVGVAEWEASAGVSGITYADMHTPDAASGGVALAVTGA